MPKKQIFLIISLFLFVQFIIFSFLVHKNLFTHFDFNTTVHLQDKISRRWDNEFSLLSDLGKFEVSTVILFVIFAVSRKLKAGLIALGFYVSFHLIEIFGKTFVNHSPPPEFMLRTKQIINMPEFHIRAENSYPSGHAGRTLFLSVLILTFVWQSKRLSTLVKILLTLFVLAYDGTMLVSRVDLGEHWTTDVIAGSMLGAAFGFFCAIFLVEKETYHGKEHKKGLFPKYKVEIKRVS